jgi:transcription elongation GreA/GreB family factor
VIEKSKLVDAIVTRLETELAAMTQAAESSRIAATHEESRAEDSHDTRGLEASYLAGAQAGRASELKQLISVFRLMNPRSFSKDERIDVGALIELAQGAKNSFYFLAPTGGGTSVQIEGKTIHVIAPKAALGEELLGKRCGDVLEIEILGDTREYTVLQVS